MKPSVDIKPKKSPVNKLLLILLPVLMIGITYLISVYGNKAGYLMILGMIGLVVAFISIIYPEFGYYSVIVFSFFIFDIIRFTMTDLPLGTFVDILVYLTFIGVIIRKIQLKESFWKYCSSPIVFVYIIVILYSIIEVFNPMGAPFSVSFSINRRFLSLMLFLYCSIQLFRDERSMIRFLKIYFVLALIAALYGCYQQWFGYPAYEMRYIMANPLGERLLSLGGGNYRKFSFFAGPADYGLLMAAAALILLIFALNLKIDIRKRLLLVAACIFSLLAMSYSGTRTATMMFVLGILLYIIMTLNNVKTLVFTALFSMVFIFIIYGPIYGNATINRLRSTFDLSDDESYKVRDINRHSIQPFIYSHPIGGGLGTSGVGSSSFVPGHPLADFPSDSGLLRMAVEYGWIGVLILFITYIVGLQQGIHAYYRSRNSRYKILFLVSVIGLFGYIVAQYAQVAIGMIPGAFLFYGLIAIVIRLRQIELSTTNQSD